MAKSSTGEVATWFRSLVFPGREPTQERSQLCPTNTTAARLQRAFHTSLCPAHSETASSRPPWSPGTPPFPPLIPPPGTHRLLSQLGSFSSCFLGLWLEMARASRKPQERIFTILETREGEIKVLAGPHTVYKNLGKVPFWVMETPRLHPETMQSHNKPQLPFPRH